MVKQILTVRDRPALATFYLNSEKYLLGDTPGSVSLEGLNVMRPSEELEWGQMMIAGGAKKSDAQIQEWAEGVENAWLEGYRRGPLSTYALAVDPEFKQLPTFKTISGAYWTSRNPVDFENHCTTSLVPQRFPPPPKPILPIIGAD